jgi:hypothetical protein
MPDKRPSVKNEKQYEALNDKGMSKERAAKIANSPGASSRGGKKSGSGGDSRQGGTTAQKKAAGRKGGKATAGRSSFEMSFARQQVANEQHVNDGAAVRKDEQGASTATEFRHQPFASSQVARTPSPSLGPVRAPAYRCQPRSWGRQDPAGRYRQAGRAPRRDHQEASHRAQRCSR